MHPLCPDFDLCANCEALPIPQHPENHPMLKIKKSETVIPTVYRLGQTSAMTPSDCSKCSQTQEEAASVRVPATNSAPSPDSNQPPLMCFDDSARPALSPVKPSSPATLGEFNVLDASATDTSAEVGTIPSVSPQLLPLDLPVVGLLNDTTQSPLRQSLTSSNVPTPLAFGGIKLPDLTADGPSTEIEDIPASPAGACDVSMIDVSDPTQKIPPELVPVPSPACTANGTQEIAPTVPSNDKASWTADVLLALTNLLQKSLNDPSVEVASPADNTVTRNPVPDVPVLDNIDVPLSDFPRDSEDLLRGSPMSAGASEIHSPSEQLAISSTRSLSALIIDYQSVANSPTSEKQEVNQTHLSASYVQCMTVSDGQIFAPGVTFVKCWKLLNDGSRDWPESTEVTFVGGASLTGDRDMSHHVGAVKSGESKDVYTTELKAPEYPGKYTSYWSLRDDKAQIFGPTIWIDIEVVETGRADSVEDFMSSSSVIVMPEKAPVSPIFQGDGAESASARDSDDMEDNLSDSSSVSMVSFQSSDDEDAGLWADSRREVDAEHLSPTRDFVVLYDDNSSEEE